MNGSTTSSRVSHWHHAGWPLLEWSPYCGWVSYALPLNEVGLPDVNETILRQ